MTQQLFLELVLKVDDDKILALITRAMQVLTFLFVNVEF